METYLKKIIPSKLIGWARIIGLLDNYKKLLSIKRYYFGRLYKPGESSKAKPRRIREDFFHKYCQGKGLDIGYGGDLLLRSCQGWDIEHGDAQYLQGIGISEFDFVYSSHTLEHLSNPDMALKNWWKVLKPGGYLILYLPHRDLYEKKKTLPSNFNLDHKYFFLLEADDPPDTIGIIPFIERNLTDYKIVDVKVCNEGHTINDPEIHSDGEYSIEVIIKKMTSNVKG